MAESNRPLNTMDEVAYRELQRENEELKKKVREAEGETSIVKAIGMNSPEMRRLKKEICELRIDNRKLAHQIEDRIDQLRKAGM